MFDYCKGDFGQVLYGYIEDERESIVENYGDEPHELLLAHPAQNDIENIETLTEIIDCYNFDFIIPEDNFEEYVIDKIENTLGDFIRNKEAGVWPYTCIEINIEAAVETAQEDIVEDTICLDGQDWLTVSE